MKNALGCKVGKKYLLFHKYLFASPAALRSAIVYFCKVPSRLKNNALEYFYNQQNRYLVEDFKGFR